MSIYPTISPSFPELKSQDFGFLREKSLAELQKLAGQIWTDYNLHDPGVTLLEALIYAMVELGYRQDNPIATLLASHPSAAIALEDHFHRAKYILPNCPYSPEDYRKFFIDIPGVRNIFLERAIELCPILYCRWEESLRVKDACEDGCCPSLAFNRDIAQDGWEIVKEEKLHLNGLYRFFLQFEEEVYNDFLNSYTPPFVNVATGVVTAPITISGQLYRGTFQLPKYETLDKKVWGDECAIIKTIKLGRKITPIKKAATPRFQSKINVHFIGSRKVQSLPVTFELEPIGKIKKKKIIGKVNQLRTDEISFATPRFNAPFQTALTSFFTNMSIGGMIPIFQKKVLLASQVLQQVKLSYCAKRNLCEDLEDVKLLLPQDVEVRVSIDLTNKAKNPEQIIAKALFAIDQYLNPAIPFYKLQELLDEGMPVEKIYEGPLLRYGFIKQQEICDFDRRTTVYNSDLIRLIACQEGVEAVRDLLSCSSIDGVDVISPEENCFDLEKSGCYYFRLNLKENLKAEKICCFKGNVMVDLDMAVIEYEFNRLKSELPKRELNDECLELPESKAVNLEDWHSVQHDLPRVYGIGEDGLSTVHETARHAKAKQLKGYLMLFEQLMANFLSQLANVRDLFSMESNVYHSYFYQPLYSLPNIEPLFKAKVDSGASWNTFMANVSNDYMLALEKAAEDYSSFLERRNRFLDHLLGRVAEDIIDFENWVSATYKDDPDFILEELIRVKQNLIKNYPDLSAPRATALNYCKKKGGVPDVWNTENISGYLRRVCAKIGLINCRRRNLCGSIKVGDVFTINQFSWAGTTIWSFYLRNESGNLLLVNPLAFSTGAQLDLRIDEVIDNGIYRENFEIKTTSTGKYYANLIDPDAPSVRLGVTPFFDSKDELRALIDEVILLLRRSFNNEGIHLVEHILLRPQNKEYQLLCPFLCSREQTKAKRYLHDPYSFVMTIVLPSGYERDFSDPDAVPIAMDWFPHFRDLNYRQMVETVLRKEAPAHIYLSIYWLDCDTSGILTEHLSLNHFESLYQIWLEELCLDDNARKEGNDAMVGFMNQLLPTKKCEKQEPIEPPPPTKDPYHIVFVIEESKNISHHYQFIKEGLKGFLSSIQGTDTYVSLIGMSERDDNMRNDHVIYSIESNNDLLTWIDNYGTANSEGTPLSSFWASAYQEVINSIFDSVLIPMPTIIVDIKQEVILSGDPNMTQSRGYVLKLGTKHFSYIIDSNRDQQLNSQVDFYMPIENIPSTDGETDIDSTDYFLTPGFTDIQSKLENLHQSLITSNIITV